MLRDLKIIGLKGIWLRNRPLRFALYFATAAFTSHLPALHSPGQLPLDEATRQRALILGQMILSPIADVRGSQSALRELSRIPAPESLLVWKTVLLNPRAFPAPVRLTAVETIMDFRGTTPQSTSSLLAEAMGKETVREVMWTIARVLEKQAGSIPAGLPLVTLDPRPEWRAYSERTLEMLRRKFSNDIAASPRPDHSRCLSSRQASF